MKKITIILFLLICSLLPVTCNAENSNIFGLHLTQTSDIDKVASLINSSRGDWGWITIVIRQDQLDPQTWQDFFNRCRQLHLIPIIRLATIMENGYWKQPEFSDIDSLASFLNSLNWPTLSQHIILFNEINHDSEWGEGIDVKKYADIAIYAATKFKQLNSNFVVLGSALDLASPETPPTHKSAANVYREIYFYRPEYFESMDALASHSYPNHGYIGLPTDTGQHSIRGYLWEKNYLKSLGVKKDYPVFITETGWPHREGDTPEKKYYTSKTTAIFLTKAIAIWNQDPKILAITPFIYNFPHPPFEHFSWVDKNEILYPEYQVFFDLPKTANKPSQLTDFQIVKNHLPLLMFTGNEYGGQVTLKNTGQSIWGETNFCLKPQSSANITLDAICTHDAPVQPGQSAVFHYKFTINSPSDKTYIGWDKLPQFEINPLTHTGILYSPNLSWKDKLLQFFNNLSL